MAKTKKLTKLERAKKRVKQLRRFYRHVLLYVLVNLMLFVFQSRITVILVSKEALGNPDILKPVDWDLFGTPIVWGAVLLLHALKVYIGVPAFGKKWEERQIRKYMEKEGGDI
ncbi:2TM domain-containing protein [Maribacter sp. 2-571]|uniref:2TM domain-containing protein n=1 Tax=Maribacter sp. 2-571 TaxID=3417569 RepID=UPI003D33CA4B